MATTLVIEDLKLPGDVLRPGLATSIGSLPHCDPSDAVDFVLRHHPRFPAAPSLPARSYNEGMIAQAAHGVPGIISRPNGQLNVDSLKLDPECELTDRGFSSDSFVGLRAFLTAVGDRKEPIKVSLTGPVTFAMSMYMSGVDADLALKIATRTVSQRAKLLVSYVEQRVPEAPLFFFIDEPVMDIVTFSGFPICALDALDAISTVLAQFETHANTGLHCCGKADWGLMLETGCQVLSLPLESNIESNPGALADYLESGKWIAWGVVPTDRPLGTTVERLWRLLNEVWQNLVIEGCDPLLLRKQALITPACGMFRHGATQAEQVLSFTNRIASRLHNHALSYE